MCEPSSKQLEARSAWVMLIDRYCWMLLVQSPNAIARLSTAQLFCRTRDQLWKCDTSPSEAQNLSLPVIRCDMRIFPLLENIY